jgi:hypothetical protein
MKHAKTLGLIGMVVALMVPFAGSASATALTSGAATYTGEFTATATGVELHRETFAEGKFGITCNKSTIKGAVVNHGLAVTATVQLTSAIFAECVNLLHPATEVKLLKPSALEIHTAPGDTGGTSGSGTVTWNAPFELTTSIGGPGFGEHCIFKLASADVGSITGSKGTGATAKLNLDAFLSTSLGCGLSAELTAPYTITTPDNLNVH